MLMFMNFIYLVIPYWQLSLVSWSNKFCFTLWQVHICPVCGGGEKRREKNASQIKKQKNPYTLQRSEEHCLMFDLPVLHLLHSNKCVPSACETCKILSNLHITARLWMCQRVEDSHFNVLMVLLGIRRLVVQRLKHKKEDTNKLNVPTRSHL